MVHSQGVYFGYGLVMPTHNFVQIFPGSFRLNRNNEWKKVGNLDTELIKFLYFGDHVFITTRSVVDYGFEKGRVYNPYLWVNLEAMIQEAHETKDWFLQTFPGQTLGFYMFGNETD
ncbi:Hypothetical protein HVR_LOCUS104 [uncultured virus]|nr:Hypothetical protein HVR_LOCUS104 [uncultured virus]